MSVPVYILWVPTKQCSVLGDVLGQNPHLVEAIHADKHGQADCNGDKATQEAHVELIERRVVGEGVEHRSGWRQGLPKGQAGFAAPARSAWLRLSPAMLAGLFDDRSPPIAQKWRLGCGLKSSP